MGWWRKVIGLSKLNPKDAIGPADLAERLTGQGRSGTVKDVAELGDRDAIQGWLRQLEPQCDQQVLVHRTWGTVVAVADGRSPVSVFWTNGDTTWYAVPPGVRDEQDLAPQQVEQILLDALTSPGPPTWPRLARPHLKACGTRPMYGWAEDVEADIEFTQVRGKIEE